MNWFWLTVPWIVAIAAVVCAAAYYRRTLRLRHEVTRLTMRHLRSQINPHFLFNTLNAISELGYADPAAADRTITQLGKLLRAALDTSNHHEIALGDELDILRQYMKIQQTLLQDRLTVTFNIEATVQRARVPSMILQPLAENAMTHGGVAGAQGGEVRVEVHRDRGALIIEISDNGPGLPERRVRERIGLSNTRQRLTHLYGNDQQFELVNRMGGGATARLRIPFHEAYAYDEDSQPYR